MTLSKEQFMKLTVENMYVIQLDAENIIENLQAQFNKEANIKFEMAKEIGVLKLIIDYCQERNGNLVELINDLQQKLKEKQLIIEAKKFADFKPIDNSRVCRTTPIQNQGLYPWTVLSTVLSLPPKDKIIEVRPQGSFFSAPGILMKWSKVEQKWLRLDGKENRNTWGEWRIAPNPWIQLMGYSIPLNSVLEVLDNSGEIVLVHWSENHNFFVKVDPISMYMTTEIISFSTWRLFIQ